LSGGGTAGHIYPALALAAELRSRGHELVYVGTPQGPEAHLAAEAGLDFVAAPAAGFDRARPWTLLTSSLKIARSAWKLRRFFTQWRPEAIVGFGGYVAVPVGLAARLVRPPVPVVVHEQNSVPGMTNRFLARHACAVALTYPQTAEHFGGRRVVLTGDPVRPEIRGADPVRGRARLGIPPEALMLLVFGGSRGARHINEALVRELPELLAADPALHIVHAAGPEEVESVREQTRTAPARYHLFAYLDDIADVMAAADLALTRAGATTIAELTALGIPALLVPFPYATGDHQTSNARDLVRAGAAVMLPDDQLDGPEFADILRELLADGHGRDTMARAAQSLRGHDAAESLADLVESVA